MPCNRRWSRLPAARGEHDLVVGDLGVMGHEHLVVVAGVHDPRSTIGLQTRRRRWSRRLPYASRLGDCPTQRMPVTVDLPRNPVPNVRCP